MDEIAKEMSDALNAAQADYESAKQADAEATRVMDAKRVAVDGMLDCLCDFLVAAGETDLVKDLEDVETDTVVDMLDSAIELAKTLEKLGNLEFAGLPIPLSIPRADKKEDCKCGKGDCGCNKPDAFTVKAVNPDADAIIKAFLRNV
ncbi:MAG: hypothetical protein IKT93_00495 [Clostridia bacterium]|nr:hypothetical protein [Clostridia bacterium]